MILCRNEVSPDSPVFCLKVIQWTYFLLSYIFSGDSFMVNGR